MTIWIGLWRRNNKIITYVNNTNHPTARNIWRIESHIRSGSHRAQYQQRKQETTYFFGPEYVTGFGVKVKGAQDLGRGSVRVKA